MINMELWIRSQNKEWFGKIDNIEAGECSDRMMVRLQDATYSDEYDIYANGDIWVGTYKNRERALEILDEIQKLLNPMLIFKNCNCTKDVLDNIREVGACIVSDNAHIEQVQTCIYEMPEE